MMKGLRRIFVIVFFVFSSTFVTAAQEIPPSYGFLEVVDYKNEPVADATVQQGAYQELSNNRGYPIEKTNQNGMLEKGIPIQPGGSSRVFSIEKSGFHTFFDCFGLFGFLSSGWRNNKDTPIRIELLKIPQTDVEKKAIGKEQLKRELFLAIYGNDTAAVRRLLKAKISPNLTTGELRGVPVSKSLPAVVYAADLANIDAIRELLASGAKIRAEDSPTSNILVNYLLAPPFRLFYPQSEEGRAQRMIDYENGVELLIKAGANLHAKDEYENSLLMIASERGYLRTVKTLLKKGTLATEKDRALLLAAQRGHIDVVDVLLKNHADPNYLYDDYGLSYYDRCKSPIIAAVERNDLKLVKLLIEGGANVNLSCKNGTSVFSKALQREANYYYDTSFQLESRKIIDLLFDSGLNVRTPDAFGETPLMKAVYYNNVPAAERLIAMGVFVNERNKEGSTALMKAASSLSRRTLDMVKLLLKSGANASMVIDANRVGYEGRTYSVCESPLINAAVNADISDESDVMTDVMQLLVDNGANVNFKCSSGETALTRAAQIPSVKGTKKLIELGADVKGEQGTLALKYAKERLKDDWNKRAERVVAMLEAAGAK